LIYNRETRQVIADTCSYKAVLSATDTESQRYFSDLVGTYDKYRIAKSQQYEQFTHFKTGSSTSIETQERARIKPEEFATLDKIVLLSPFGVFKVDKAPYYKDKPKVLTEQHKKAAEFRRNMRNSAEKRAAETKSVAATQSPAAQTNAHSTTQITESKPGETALAPNPANAPQNTRTVNRAIFAETAGNSFKFF
jgi:type IV secretory pathway TraG/TraD family ATPase VirD4